MDITPVVPADRKLIQAYGDGAFVISRETFAGAVLVFPDKVVAWPVTDAAGIALADFRPVIEAVPAPEVLLVGCGACHRLLPAPVRRGLSAAGVGLDSMDTGAACRTYNVLVAEDRRVVAALLPV